MNLKPVTRSLLCDVDTPVSLYLKCAQTPSFLLESVTGGEQLARYSYIGLDPLFLLLAENGETCVYRDGEEQRKTGSPLTILADLIADYSIDELAEFAPFLAGAVGYFSWEIIEEIESLSLRKKTASGYPLAHFMFPKTLLVFDHVKRFLTISVLAEKGAEHDAEKRIDSIIEQINAPLYSHSILPFSGDPFDYVQSNYSQSEFEKQVEQAKQHIYDGDVFQLVLSQRFSVKSKKKPFDTYRTLRSINPSPYMFYFDFGSYQMIGSSPEILVRLQGNKATLRPIAGTRPRIDGQEERLENELLRDEKEIAEHVMLVDLARNDLGRVCEYDSVQTTAFKTIERYSHVIHITSTVQGELKAGKSAFDLFSATFPAGTLSGAPKFRAIELIDKFEPIERGPYGGALGFVDCRGNMDLCIIIRTVLHQNGDYVVQAGAGIVADSVPESEYNEAKNKAKGMLGACLEYEDK